MHFFIKSARNCAKDEGRLLGVGLQEQASNHLKLRWYLRANSDELLHGSMVIKKFMLQDHF